VDLNGDGRLDVLYTNGDSMDTASRQVSLHPSRIDDHARGGACGGCRPRRRRPAGRGGG
jgi:hypothetical protein